MAEKPSMNTAIKKYVAKYTNMFETCSDRSGVLKMFSNFSFIEVYATHRLLDFLDTCQNA